MPTTPAAAIVESLGGAANITSLTHCATRLRFELRDASGVDPAAIDKIPGVMGSVPQAGDRYQVVIGGAVQNVYNDIMALPDMARVGTGAADDMAATKAAARAGGPRGRFAWLDSLFEFLSDSFRPILGALLGASLFITFMSLMSTLNVIPNWADPRTELSPSWQFINLCWKAVFVFLPLMVAYNASKKLKADPWVGFAIMGVVMLPGFLDLQQYSTPVNFAGSDIHVVSIFGLPLTIFDYSSQVFPPLMMAAVLGLVYKGLKRIIPDNLQLIFVPFLSMLIMIPLTSFLIGPIGVYAGAGLAGVLSSINSFSPFIFAIVIPLAYPFMVPLGLHWPINAIMLLNIQNLGYDFIQGPMGAWNFACFGATAGVLFLSIRDKDVQMRQTATGALAAGLLGGISEPSLYGIHLRFKRIYPRILIGCFVGGLIIGIGGGLHTSAFVFTSLLTIPAFSNIPLYVTAIAASFIVSMVLVITLDYRTPEQKMAAIDARKQADADLAAEVSDNAKETVVAAPRTPKPALVPGAVTVVGSPMAGEVMALSDVPDAVFAQGMAGLGVGILPSGDTVQSPGPGKIIVAHKTGHAFGILLDSGIELLIHVGLDTVKLEGKGFDVKVQRGDRVEAGDLLVTFDRTIIEQAGYSLVTPVLITNHKKFAAVEQSATGTVGIGDDVITVTAKPAEIRQEQPTSN